MFENMNEQQAREEILKQVVTIAINIIIQRRNLRRETVFHTRHVFMTARRW